jgi:molecular chaperone GrpE
MQSSREIETGEQDLPQGDTSERGDRARELRHDQPERAGADSSDELALIEDRYKRALADLDNYRKRSAREVQRRVDEARESVLRDWLDTLDSVERAMRMQADGPCYDGLRAVLRQMDGVLSRHGVERIATPGDPFDPQRHEAIAVRASDELPDRTIVEVQRSGFALGDRVIRPAQVVVARAPEHAR